MSSALPRRGHPRGPGGRCRRFLHEVQTDAARRTIIPEKSSPRDISLPVKSSGMYLKTACTVLVMFDLSMFPDGWVSIILKKGGH